jgi:hypothetical protein
LQTYPFADVSTIGCVTSQDKLLGRDKATLQARNAKKLLRELNSTSLTIGSYRDAMQIERAAAIMPVIAKAQRGVAPTMRPSIGYWGSLYPGVEA